MTPTSDLLAAPSGTKVKADDLIGYLTMFTMPDRMTERALVEKEWQRAGLDVTALPKPPELGDIFQQACMAVQSKRKGKGDEVIVQLAGHSKGEYTYQITRSVKDEDNRVIEHPKAMSVNFSIATGRITVTRREEWGAMRMLERTIRANFESFQTKIAGPRVRSVIRDMLVNGLYGTNYMGKGAYLVPQEGLDRLEAIKAFLSRTYGHDGHVVLIPMLRTKANTDDLARFHADDVKERAGALIGRITERLKANDRAPRSEMLSAVVAERRQLQSLRDRIVEIVGSEIAVVDEQLKLLAKQTERLFEAAGQDLEAAA